MVNVFGEPVNSENANIAIFGDQNIRGQRGPPGKNAVEVGLWCPTGVMEMFRKDEQCTIFFNTGKDGLLYDKAKKVIGLKDQYGENHAICEHNFRKPIKVGKYYAIPLNDSLYKISDIKTATEQPSICIIVLQFKVSGELTEDKDVYIICNETLTRGVKINKSNLTILGTDSMKLTYADEDWNTLIIQYSYLKSNDGKCFFTLNGARGTFVHHKDVESSYDLYIGGTKEKKDFARVLLANFELYWLGNPLPDPYLLPESILNSIQYDLDDRVGDEKMEWN